MFNLIVIILLSILFVSNKLLFDTYTNKIKQVLSDNFLGKEDTSVSSFQDFKKFSIGAVNGLLFPPTLERINLEIKQQNIIKISPKNTDERKWVPAFISLEDKQSGKIKMKSKIRQKGDRKIHQESIDKMSYRVNIKGDNRLFGLEEFSIQRPVMRGYTWELLIAKIFNEENLLTLKSTPIKFFVNGDNRGIYIVEEVPNSRTIERNQKKSGPIFGLNESISATLENAVLDVYDLKEWEDSPIYEFSKKLLYSEFKSALNNKSFSSKTFDMEEWAKYFALSDLFGSHHATVPKSVKFYFNPVIGKFQPLLFDAHFGESKNFIILDFLQDKPNCSWMCNLNYFYSAFLKNEIFLEFYINFLSKYANNQFIESIINAYDVNFKSLDNLLYSKLSRSDMIFWRGFSFYIFKPEILNNRAIQINKKLEIHNSRYKTLLKVEKETMKSEVFGELIVKKDIKIIKSNNIQIQTNNLIFKSPTLWLLSGDNELFGIDGETLKIVGPVMIVQNKGKFITNKLALIGNEIIDVKNRNWSGIINIIDSEIRAEKIFISKNKSEDAINIINSTILVDEIELNNTLSDGIDFDFAKGSVKKITCAYIGNDCVDGSESSISIDNIYSTNVKDKVISAGENSKISIQNLNIKNSAIGVVSKDGSILDVESIIVDNVDLFAAVFNKKTEYLSPILKVKDIQTNTSLESFQSIKSILELPKSSSKIELLDSSQIESLLYGSVYGTATKK